MFRVFKVSWHKARALSALQVYFDQPFKEPLAAPIAIRLRHLSLESLKHGGTPIDTALTYYVEYAGRAVEDGMSLNDLNYGGVLGRTFALRDEMKFYAKHHRALINLGRMEAGEKGT